MSEYEWIDECFRVYETPFKLWHSVDKDAKEFGTAQATETCIRMTQFYLKGLQEGWSESRVLNDGVVGGKL